MLADRCKTVSFTTEITMLPPYNPAQGSRGDTMHSLGEDNTGRLNHLKDIDQDYFLSDSPVVILYHILRC